MQHLHGKQTDRSQVNISLKKSMKWYLTSVEAPTRILNYNWKLVVHLEAITQNTALAKSIPINSISRGQQV